MLLNLSKPKQSSKHRKSSIKIKTSKDKYKSKSKKESFSFSLPPSFATIKVSKPKKRSINKPILKRITNSNSTSNLNKKGKKKSKSREKKEKAKNDNIYKTIPIRINQHLNNFDLIMPSNSSEIELTKDNKNSYCTIVPQVLNLLNLNIYKINSTNKSQIYTTQTHYKYQNKKKKNSSHKKISLQSCCNKKICIKRSFEHKNDINLLKTTKNKKNRRIYNINKMILETNLNENNNNLNNYFEKDKKSGALTSRQFSSSPNKIDEENIIKNILISPSTGNIGFIEIKNDIANKKRNAVIPIRKGIKKINNIRENVPLTSRCFMNNSITRNKKKGNVSDKNHFNLGVGIIGNSNSIVNKANNVVNEINKNDINTICSVKSIGHIFKMKKNSNPYNKPSLNIIINNNK
jgi:hypothetical protein